MGRTNSPWARPFTPAAEPVGDWADNKAQSKGDWLDAVPLDEKRVNHALQAAFDVLILKGGAGQIQGFIKEAAALTASIRSSAIELVMHGTQEACPFTDKKAKRILGELFDDFLSRMEVETAFTHKETGD